MCSFLLHNSTTGVSLASHSPVDDRAKGVTRVFSFEDKIQPGNILRGTIKDKTKQMRTSKSRDIFQYP